MKAHILVVEDERAIQLALRGLLTRAGYDFTPMGENLAVGQTTATEVFDEWLASPSHLTARHPSSSDDPQLVIDVKPTPVTCPYCPQDTRGSIVPTTAIEAHRWRCQMCGETFDSPKHP